MNRRMLARRTLNRYLGLFLVIILIVCFCAAEAEAKSKKVSVHVSTYTAHYSNGTIRTYRKYRQYTNYKTGGFFYTGSQLYCMLTSVSIAASGFGVYHAPQAIHGAKQNESYGEKYALQKIGMRFHRKMVHSPFLAAQILNDMGIQSRYVPVYEKNCAEIEIKEHLESGKPVIVVLKSNTWKGIRLAYWRHAIVLVKLDGNGTVRYINPNAPMNGSKRGSIRRGIQLTIRELLDHYMFSSSGNYEKAYITGYCGGYILVGSES